jgi:hypothetical protein
MQLRSVSDAGLDDCGGVALALEHGRYGVDATLADGDALALAVLIGQEAAIAAVLLQLRGIVWLALRSGCLAECPD